MLQEWREALGFTFEHIAKVLTWWKFMVCRSQASCTPLLNSDPSWYRGPLSVSWAAWSLSKPAVIQSYCDVCKRNGLDETSPLFWDFYQRTRGLSEIWPYFQLTESLRKCYRAFRKNSYEPPHSQSFDIFWQTKVGTLALQDLNSKIGFKLSWFRSCLHFSF